MPAAPAFRALYSTLPLSLRAANSQPQAAAKATALEAAFEASKAAALEKKKQEQHAALQDVSEEKKKQHVEQTEKERQQVKRLNEFGLQKEDE